MYITLFKLLHIIGFTTWMGGIFYLGRIFVHHVESLDKPEPDRRVLHEQFTKMEGLVWRIILKPAAIITWAAGLSMIIINPTYLSMGWFHLKLTLVVLFTGYHIYCAKPKSMLARGEKPWTPFTFRLWNEVPTVFLVAIAALGVYQYQINYGILFVSVAIFTTLIYSGAKAYQTKRLKK
jgi:protoporphyrinogen IX oxidase